MNLAKLAEQAKKLIGKRGGMASVKEDVTELEPVATEQGSLTDKVRDAAEAIKDPGAPGEPAAPAAPSEPAPPAP